MSTPRFYTTSNLVVADKLQFEGSIHHHLCHVLRAKVGDLVILFNGQGGEYLSEISAIRKRSVMLTLLDFIDSDRESPLSITLAPALISQDRMDWLIQKAVELGVTKITPIVTDYVNSKIRSQAWLKRKLHWEKIIINACQQCGRNRLAQIQQPQPLETWLKTSDIDVVFACHPGTSHSLQDISKQCPSSVAVIIGPEGGLSEQDLEYLQSSQVPCIPLSPRILRAETAAVTALALAQFYWGDILSP